MVEMKPSFDIAFPCALGTQGIVSVRNILFTEVGFQGDDESFGGVQWAQDH